MKKQMICGVVVFVLICCLAGMPAHAQDKVTVFGGYSYLMFRPDAGANSPARVNFNGGIGSISYNPLSWLGGVAEIAGYHAGTISVNGVDIPGVSANAVTYLFGPKIFMPGKFSPFAQVLFGGVHGSATGTSGSTSVTVSQNGFGLALGGGLDWNATAHIGVRVGQIEYLMSRFANNVNNGIGQGGTGTQNNFRYSAGVVFRF